MGEGTSLPDAACSSLAQLTPHHRLHRQGSRASYRPFQEVRKRKCLRQFQAIACYVHAFEEWSDKGQAPRILRSWTQDHKESCCHDAGDLPRPERRR